MTWAGERRLKYITGVLVFLLIVGAAVFWRYFKKAPTCTDGLENGTETGVDCGGICPIYCKNEISTPKIRFKRSFVVTPTASTAIAYIEHGYAGASARNVKYQFDLFDANNSIVATRTGSTFIGTIGKTAIVEPLIQVDGSKVAWTRFSFVGDITWEKTDPDISTLVIKTDVTNAEIFAAGTRVRAVLENKSDRDFTNMPVVVVLYDTDENAIATSVAQLPSLKAGENLEKTFTWPDQSLFKSIARIEVIPRINPFTLSQKNAPQQK